jgi:hypothetical protein
MRHCALNKIDTAQPVVGTLADRACARFELNIHDSGGVKTVPIKRAKDLGEYTCKGLVRISGGPTTGSFSSLDESVLTFSCIPLDASFASG